MAAVAVSGSLAQRPGHGGHAWVFLNYLLGLRRLGHEVTFLDRFDADSEGARWLQRVMEDAGLGDDYLLVSEDPASHRAARERLGAVDLLIDVNGYLGDEELLDAAETTAFLDIDPGIQQMWEELGQASLFGRHDLHLTVGENIGAAECTVPTCGVEWLGVRQPVLIGAWEAVPGGEGFSTVATWRGPYAPIEFNGQTFGLRAHEFRRFFGLPGRVPAGFRLALDIEPADQRDIAALGDSGWELLEPLKATATPAAYKLFIHGSLAELAIAKQVYVASRCGWFSDRSACYLASGRPVIAVDTGFSQALPTGEGLLCVTDVDSAAAACEEVLRDPARHQRAAREIANEYFDSDRVLGGILDAAGI